MESQIITPNWPIKCVFITVEKLQNTRVCVQCINITCADFALVVNLQQNNLSNPPTPPASLPPTPPPVNRQKMINGFATTEELASKAAAMGKHLAACSYISEDNYITVRHLHQLYICTVGNKSIHTTLTYSHLIKLQPQLPVYLHAEVVHNLEV